MGSPYTAILQLREAVAVPDQDELADSLRRISGVGAVDFEELDPVLTVGFDGRTGLGEIVRVVEDEGLVVTSVSQRARAFHPDGRPTQES